MQARFRIHASSLLLVSLALLGRPDNGNAQVTDYNYWSGGNTADIQQRYINFAAQSSSGMNFATTYGPNGTEGLKRVRLLLGGPDPENYGFGTCLEVTTSIATTGYPSTHIWLLNSCTGCSTEAGTGARWQSISSGSNNYVRIFASMHAGLTFAPYIFAGSSSTNNKDFNLQIKRIITPNSANWECQVAGKPFIDYSREDANGFYTADTN